MLSTLCEVVGAALVVVGVAIGISLPAALVVAGVMLIGASYVL